MHHIVFLHRRAANRPNRQSVAGSVRAVDDRVVHGRVGRTTRWSLLRMARWTGLELSISCKQRPRFIDFAVPRPHAHHVTRLGPHADSQSGARARAATGDSCRHLLSTAPYADRFSKLFSLCCSVACTDPPCYLLPSVL